jgi:hypothetical protein
MINGTGKVLLFLSIILVGDTWQCINSFGKVMTDFTCLVVCSRCKELEFAADIPMNYALTFNFPNF